LDFLYRASRRLHTSEPLRDRLEPVLEELQTLTPLREIQLQLYENNNDQEIDEVWTPDGYSGAGRAAPLGNHPPMNPLSLAAEPQQLSWSLHDKLGQYGLMLARYPRQQAMDDTQQQLVNTLAAQLTSTLALERQAEHQQHLLLMAERSAIARELHDSIAQSLSCLKLQIGCLQMQSADAAPENQRLMQQMRDELNTAYRQLREL